MQEVHRCIVVYLFFEWNNYIVIKGYPGHGMERVRSYTGVSLFKYPVMEWNKHIVIQGFPYLRTWVMERSKYISIFTYLGHGMEQVHSYKAVSLFEPVSSP